MSFNIVVSSSFEREVKTLKKKYPSLKADISHLIDLLQENPILGKSIGKDCYKIRLAITSKGKGKRGGARVLTCVKVVKHTLFLLSIYDKSDKETISDNELVSMLEEAGLL